MLGYATTCILIALATILPAPRPVVQYCDRIELNRVYDAQGCETFAQVIFWSDGHVRDWKIADHVRLERTADNWAATWHDGCEWRRVVAPRLVTTWTQYDREVADRKRLGQHDRWRLTPTR